MPIVITVWYSSPFIFTLKTNPLVSGYSYNVNWGIGEPADPMTYTGDSTHNYTTAGSHDITITGNFEAFYFGGSLDSVYLRDVKDWGSGNWKSFERAFFNCSNLASFSAPNTPNIVGNPTYTSFSRCFWACTTFNHNINNWNMSTVDDMSGMFSGAHIFNSPIDSWNVSNVTLMGGMFSTARAFNQPLANWERNTPDISTLSNVIEMGSMFEDSFSSVPFDRPIGNWNVSSVTSMEAMFRNSRFNQDIGNWDVSSVINMDSMFYGTDYFNQDLSRWCVILIPSVPSNFDVGNVNWVLPDSRPIWGTCSPPHQPDIITDNGPPTNYISGYNGDIYIDSVTGNVYGPNSLGVWPPPSGNIYSGSFLSGSGDPNTNIIMGVFGSFYLDTLTCILYGPKTTDPPDTTWPTPGIRLGPNFLTGTVDPTSEGKDGDYYLNTTSKILYGPKTLGGWPSIGTELGGGSGGSTIYDGTSDPDGFQLGNTGDYYINTLTNVLFGPKNTNGDTNWSGVNKIRLGGTKLLSGSGAPSVVADAGDFYLDTGNNLLYGPKLTNNDSNWTGVYVTKIGQSTIHYGSGAPSIDASAGDYYIDSSNERLYGPKVTALGSAVWPTNYIQLGAGISSGTTIKTGPIDPDIGTGIVPGITGDIGDWYLNTTNNTLYGPKTVGGNDVWPTTGILLGRPSVENGTVSPPPAALGVPGSFYINYITGEIYGPKTTTGWPTTPIPGTNPATASSSGTASILNSAIDFATTYWKELLLVILLLVIFATYGR